MTDGQLQSITAAAGINAATALLYDVVRSSAHNQKLIERVESSDGPRCVAGPSPRVLIVPGAFYREYPRTGGDGRRIIELAEELGWPVELLPLPSFSPMAQNAAKLIQFLATLPRRRTILVSLSKGGADVRAAMQIPDAAGSLRDVCAWLNLSGIISGTPLVSWLKARRLRCAGVKLLLRLRRQRFSTLDELRRSSDSPLSQPFVIPNGIKTIHVAGFPLVCHLSDSWARRGHARLTDLGPNDGGGVMLADVARLPGLVYPVWGADHYLRPKWDIRPFLARLLHEAADS